MRSRASWSARARLAFWLVLLLSWTVMMPFLWRAFTTVPSAERLAQSRMIEIPTVRTVGLIMLQSAIELVAVLALLVPWRPGRYLVRIWLAAVGVCVWFIASTPLSLTRVAWVHRRWLAAVATALLLAAVVGTIVRMFSPADAGEDTR